MPTKKVKRDSKKQLGKTKKVVKPVKLSSSKIRSNPFPIVAIGASAGGLEAVSELLKSLPSNTNMAYVYIQHLDPTHKSMLSMILSRITKMKIHEAKDKMKIEMNNLYIIPPNKDMILDGGVIKLNPRPQKPAVHMPIDAFFLSLAEKQKEGAIGIVLSGNASDGALGLKAIKTAGGLTFAQDDSAKFKSMPKNAFAEGSVDLIMSPKEIAMELERLSKQPDILLTAMAEDESENDKESGDLIAILVILKKFTGVDFTHYKKSTIKRRIIRRMLLYRLADLKDYLKYLKQYPHEIKTLFQDVLINVTTFFRDPVAIEFIKKKILPKTLKEKSVNDPLRIWVPACSTGEEAYSLAMLIIETLGERNSIPIQIFATDLSEASITKARIGIYSKSDLADVSPKRIQRFFTKVDGGYRILKSIRDMCVFATHNIFKDPPFSRIDIISCCNLLIYLDTILQKKVIATFHYALNQNGFLVLGKSETIGSSGSLFSVLDKKTKIYQRKKESASRALFDMNYRVPDAEKYPSPRLLARDIIKENEGANNLEKIVDNMLLSRFVPASVLINQDLDILHFRGSTGMFLEPAPGKASLNLLKMTRLGLNLELRNAIHKVIRSGEAYKKTGIDFIHKNTMLNISIEVIPVKTEHDEKYYLVVFEESKIPSPNTASKSSRDKRVKQLERELLASREDMRSIIEGQEAVNEELQSANEEIVSTNEELQSINEELETSKEEVESTNEELMTINQEMQIRNDQLAESYEYAEAIISTIREGAVVLDRDLRIKTANRAFYKTFLLKEDDVEGRVFFEIGNRKLDIPKLRELIEKILPNNPQYYSFEIHNTFKGIGEKVFLINARKILQNTNKVQLILLAFEDITEHALAQRAIAEREARVHAILQGLPQSAWVSDESGKIVFRNKLNLEYNGQTEPDNWAVIHPDDFRNVYQLWHSHLKSGKPFETQVRCKRNSDNTYRWNLVRASPTNIFSNGKISWVGSNTDIHEQKMFEDQLEKRVKQRTLALEDAYNSLEKTNFNLQQYAHVASHDLQEPLRKMQTFIDLLYKNIEDKNSVEKYYDKILSTAQKMSRLIFDINNLTKIDADLPKGDAIDLNEILIEVQNDFELLIAEKKAIFHVDKLPVIVGSKSHIYRLFFDIISNSLKFNNRKPIIQITSKKLSKPDLEKFQLPDKKKTYNEIVVSDNGIGFDQKHANQIFTMFQQLNVKSDYGGTGIGLALCKKIVENHRGEIFAISKLDKGTEIHIILPAG